MVVVNHIMFVEHVGPPSNTTSTTLLFLLGVNPVVVFPASRCSIIGLRTLLRRIGPMTLYGRWTMVPPRARCGPGTRPYRALYDPIGVLRTWYLVLSTWYHGQWAHGPMGPWDLGPGPKLQGPGPRPGRSMGPDLGPWARDLGPGLRPAASKYKYPWRRVARVHAGAQCMCEFR